MFDRRNPRLTGRTRSMLVAHHIRLNPLVTSILSTRFVLLEPSPFLKFWTPTRFLVTHLQRNKGGKNENDGVSMNNVTFTGSRNCQITFLLFQFVIYCRIVTNEPVVVTITTRNRRTTHRIVASTLSNTSKRAWRRRASVLDLRTHPGTIMVSSPVTESSAR